MNTLIKSNKTNKDIIKQIKKYTKQFDTIKHAFLFGSFLKHKKRIHDIDLLLIYSEYTSEVKNDLMKLENKLKKEIETFVDITSLSVEEEKEIKFLDRIKPHYLKLK